MTDFAVETEALTKLYGAVRAVDSVSLQVRQGEILALVGPSGCGKTTLLRLLAGFEQPDSGIIRLQGRLAAGDGLSLPPERRGVGMVFQDYALFPHLTVLENVAFGLQQLPRDRRERAAGEWLAAVGLPGAGKAYPHELSGGERQRVALARALIPEPVLVLMDEPFSNLDADRRLQVREDVQQVLRRLGATVVFVTHDQEEALFMGDRLAVLNQGRLEQVDAPDTVFSRPATRFVAEFLGQTDFVAGEVVPGGILTEVGLVPQPLALPHGTPVELAVRADDVDLDLETPPGGSPAGAPAQVVARYYKGIYNVYRLRLPSGQVVHSIQPHARVLRSGQPVRVRIAPGHDLACYHQDRLVQ